MKRKPGIVVLLLICVSFSLSLGQADTAIYAIINGTLIDGTGAEPLANGVVIVTGERITAVGAADGITISSAATIIDAAGGTVMPGIINAHVHLVMTGRGVLAPQDRLDLFTRAGVTGLCDLAMPTAYMYYAAPGFATAPDGSFAGRLSLAGPIITAPDGYPGTVWGKDLAYEVSTPAEAEAAVLALLAKGATQIKVALEPGDVAGDSWATLTLEQLQAVTRTAHAHNLPVHAHVQSAEMLAMALDGAVDVIQHVPIPYRWTEWSNSAELEAYFATPEGDPPLPPELIALLQRMVAEDVLLVPTLTPMIGWITPEQEAAQPFLQPYRAMIQAVVQTFDALGGRIGIGTDYGVPGVPAGLPLNELLLLQDTGLPTSVIVTAATHNSAQACGLTETGSLEVGQYADLLIVRGNPLADLAALTDLALVMVNGQIIPAQPDS